MDYEKIGLLTTAANESLKFSNKILRQKPPNVTPQKSVDVSVPEALEDQRTSFEDLDSDSLEKIACYLDSRSALNLLLTSKTILSKLEQCVHFWKHLCVIEHLDKFNALKSEEVNEERKDGAERLSWSGDKLHKVEIKDEASKWQKIYQRGVQMRRNMREGRYELWRLFMTDADSLPVKRWTQDTQPEDLERIHNNSPFNQQNRRVRVNRYWNEEFLIVIQHDINHTFNDIFVWSWKECQQPKFLYSHNLLPLYPTGLFPTSFFLYKNYLVLMPETAFSQNKRKFTSMLRVHDLTDNFKLVGSYDFPEEDNVRRHLKVNVGNESAHLHRLGDKAVALCRTPDLTFYIFSLPDGQLLKSFPIISAPRSLNLDEMDQRFLMKDNTMMFMFHDTEFFNHLFTAEEDQAQEMKYGRFLQVDFEDYVKNNGEIKMRLDNTFDNNQDYIEKICLNSNNKMTCILSSGKIVVKDMKTSSDAVLKFTDSLEIETAEALQEDYDEELDEEVDTDGPSLSCSASGDTIIALRHFVSGRKIHAYDASGALKYEICVDNPEYQLESRPGYLSMDLDGEFLVAADQQRIVIWESRTGKYVRSILLPEHYNTQEDRDEAADKFCWKGHTDFAFSEDGIIIIHSQRNFPVAADVFLFW